MKLGDLLWYNCGGSKATALVLETFVYQGDTWSYIKDGDMIVRLAWVTKGIMPKNVSWWGDAYGKECNLDQLGVKSFREGQQWYPAKVFKLVSRA